MALLGLGIDLVEVSQAQRLLDRWGERVLGRLLTGDERAYLRRYRHPAKQFAARLAAKEAVYKALQGIPGTRGVGWREIEVTRNAEGRPGVQLHGAALEAARAGGVARISLSLTHTQTTAAAVAVLEDGAGTGFEPSSRA